MKMSIKAKKNKLLLEAEDVSRNLVVQSQAYIPGSESLGPSSSIGRTWLILYVLLNY